MKKLSVLALMAIAAISTFAAGKSQTYTGEVSDSMCGAKHMMAGKAGECARACVSKGSSYALVVGDRVYALHTQDKAVLDELNKLAGGKAYITGTADGETIAVSTVAAAK